ncbi:MAG TPA: hypothetical protein VIL13_11430 [Longimicrobiales bacterium]|jgi:hypothetical protein
MRLALSTAAAPDLGLAELIDACVRRGLAGLELVSGDAHGVGPECPVEELAEARRAAEAAGIAIAAFRAADRAEACSRAAARLSAVCRAPVILPRDTAGIPEDELVAAARVFAEEGGVLLVAHGTDAEAVAALRRAIEQAPAGSLGLAWDVDPGDPGLVARLGAVLDAAGPHLRHVLLIGGGPEAAGQEGRGVGPLMGRLALARYDGAIALAPSTPRYRYAWGAWLGRRGGWGCGSRAGGGLPVRLDLER